MITEQIQNEIIDNFNMLDDDIEMSLNYLMELGEGLDPFDDELRVDDNIIKGCQSKVWLTHTFSDDKLLFSGDSNTAITKGLLSLLITVFNNRTPKEIIESKLFFINETGLFQIEENPKILAAIIAMVIGILSRSIIATIFSGLASYWFLIFVV